MREEGLRIFNHQIFSDSEIQADFSSEKTGINLVTNPLNESGKKWLGLSLSQAEQLITVCKQEHITCLIEADGARHLPLKAPAEWEPVIPPSVDLVIVVVGLSALGKPLNPETVFRPEIFSQLTGLTVGETIQLEHIIKVLNHPQGGLREIPRNSRAAVVFNQADAYLLKQNERNKIREVLKGSYTAAILTKLRTDSENCEVIFNCE